jgi:hypothetical protein
VRLSLQRSCRGFSICVGKLRPKLELTMNTSRSTTMRSNDPARSLPSISGTFTFLLLPSPPPGVTLEARLTAGVPSRLLPPPPAAADALSCFLLSARGSVGAA